MIIAIERYFCYSFQHLRPLFNVICRKIQSSDR
jgi:hypothetical protein